MEELLGALFELILEIFFNVLVEIFGEVISRFAHKVENNTKFKNKVKIIISFIFFGLSSLLLILSLIYKKKFLVTLTLSYLFVLLISNLFKFINKNYWKKEFVSIIINWIRRIAHYAFSISLIVTGSLFLKNDTAIIWLDLLSILSIIIYMGIDFYKLFKFIERKKQKKLGYYNNDLM